MATASIDNEALRGNLAQLFNNTSRSSAGFLKLFGSDISQKFLDVFGEVYGDENALAVPECVDALKTIYASTSGINRWELETETKPQSAEPHSDSSAPVEMIRTEKEPKRVDFFGGSVVAQLLETVMGFENIGERTSVIKDVADILKEYDSFAMGTKLSKTEAKDGSVRIFKSIDNILKTLIERNAYPDDVYNTLELILNVMKSSITIAAVEAHLEIISNDIGHHEP
ncbi:MAG: hypothetical protein M1504_04035 [Candidatus Marsarchaeota archaeon]|nr:hypothetical protein [Candidatus Marsarchaeota archaeon]